MMMMMVDFLMHAMRVCKSEEDLSSTRLSCDPTVKCDGIYCVVVCLRVSIYFIIECYTATYTYTNMTNILRSTNTFTFAVFCFIQSKCPSLHSLAFCIFHLFNSNALANVCTQRVYILDSFVRFPRWVSSLARTHSTHYALHRIIFNSL